MSSMSAANCSEVFTAATSRLGLVVGRVTGGFTRCILSLEREFQVEAGPARSLFRSRPSLRGDSGLSLVPCVDQNQGVSS